MILTEEHIIPGALFIPGIPNTNTHRVISVEGDRVTYRFWAANFGATEDEYYNLRSSLSIEGFIDMMNDKQEWEEKE